MRTCACMEALRGSAVQLVSQHLELHVVSAVNELCETATVAKESQSVIDQLLALCHDSSSLPRATVATEGVWRAVFGCCREGQCHLLSSPQRVKLATVLQTATSLLDRLLFLPNHFLQLVIKQQLPRLPLEVVCGLHSANLLSMGAILVSSPAAVQYMVSAVVSVSCIEDEAEGQQMVMQVVVQVLLELVTEKCTVADEMFKQLPAALFAQPRPVRYSLIQAAIDCPSLSSSSALDLASILLSSCLAHPPSTTLEVLAHQSQWQFSLLPESASSLYSDVVAALGPSHFLQIVQKTLSLEQLNWPALLQSVVCFLHYNESAPDHLAGVVKELVSGAVEEGDTHMLICGLLLARQASLEGAHVFTPYQHWFQAMFSDSATSVVGGKKQLLFLLKTLTTLVPYEPTFALKVHISHPPHLVTKYLTQINDYVNLASTRLQDLGEKVPTGPSEQTESNADRDVAEAVAYFSQHGRISQSVRKASIFKAPYFVGRFLPSLLSPSLVEEGSRNGLIAALFSEKKVPPRMMKNYEKACQELRAKGSVTSLPPLASEGVACVLGELPHAVIEGKYVIGLLSRLSAALREEAGLPSALQLADDILSAVCKTVVLQEDKVDASYRWLTDLLTILSAHTHFHEPLYLRLTELLTTQLLHLTGCQLLGLAVFLCYVLCSSPPMATVTETQKSLCRGEEYCIGILSELRHDTLPYMAQSLKFGCMFVQQLMRSNSSEQTVPASLLHKMKYMYRREKFLLAHTTDLFSSTHIQRQEAVEAVESVEALMLEHRTLADQWQSCKVNVEEWLLWELAVNPTEDAMSKQSRHSYLWNVVFSDFIHSCSTEELFIALFKTLACSNYCHTELLAIIQELSFMLPVQKESKPSVLLKALQDITTAGCREKAHDSMMLAASLPPHLLFASCQGGLVCVQFVAEFIHHTMGSLVEEMMVLPAPITIYLTRGASAMGRETLQHLCVMCPIYLASAMAHWTVLPAGLPYSAELVATAEWLHSGIPGPSPSLASNHQLHSLAVALWHYCVTGNDITIDTVLQPLPAQVVVLVTACCVDWLVQHAPLDSQHVPLDSQLGSFVKAVLQACVQQQPSSVEALHRPSLPAEVQLKHSELLASFRSTFTCNLTAFYPVLLLSLLPLFDVTMLSTLVAEPCFLWLCITAHSHCLSLCTSLPTLPPLTYQPLSVKFIQDSNAALETLIELADTSQLQSMLYQEAHRQLQPFIKTKLKVFAQQHNNN